MPTSIMSMSCGRSSHMRKEFHRKIYPMNLATLIGMCANGTLLVSLLPVGGIKSLWCSGLKIHHWSHLKMQFQA